MARETRQTARAVRQAYEERGLIPVLESRLKEEKALDLVLETATMQSGDRARDTAVTRPSCAHPEEVKHRTRAAARGMIRFGFMVVLQTEETPERDGIFQRSRNRMGESRV